MRSDVVTLCGTIVAATSTLTSPLHARACVYFSLRDGLEAKPIDVRAQRFWLQIDGERVLVEPEFLQVDARAELGQRLLSVVEGDLRSVAARLSAIKALLRNGSGPEIAALQRERRKLAEIATFLHATRAHARGRVHVGGTLEGQAQWIRERAAKSAEASALKTMQIARSAWEVALEPGQTVTITGACRTELLPPELGGDGGYRANSSARVLRGTEALPLMLVGLGAIAPSETDVARQREARWSREANRPPETHDSRVIMKAAGVCLAVVAALAAWLAR